MSELEATIRRQRKQMDQDESAARAALVASYRQTIAYLEDQIDAAVRAIEAFPDARWRVMHLQRLEGLLSVAEQRYAAFTRQATSLLEAEAIRAAGRGVLDADALMQAAGVGIGVATVNQRALARAVAATGAGPVADVLAGYGARDAALIRAKLTEAIGAGRGARDVIRELKRELRSGYNRARVESLVRTEMMRAYRGGMHEQYRSRGDELDGLRWSAAKSTRTCLACLAMDGRVFPVDKFPMHQHPNCRCIASPVPAGSTYQYQSGEDWLRGQPSRKQRAAFPSAEAYDAWRAGDVELGDFVGRRRSRRWGTTIYQRSGRGALDHA